MRRVSRGAAGDRALSQRGRLRLPAEPVLTPFPRHGIAAAFTRGKIMRRDILAAVLFGALAVLGAGGCAGRPLMDNPVFVPAGPAPGPCPNPVFLAAGPPEYGAVFEAVLNTL